jgi:phasin family protein
MILFMLHCIIDSQTCGSTTISGCTMTQPVEQFLASAKTSLADATDLAAQGFAGFEKLVELNMSTAKATLDDAGVQLRAVFSAKTPTDLSSVAGLAQPAADKAVAYGRAVADILTETATAFTKAAEGKFADLQAQAAANIDSALKLAPAGSETAVAAFKSAIAAGQQALETAQASAKQAVNAAEKNFATATDAVVKSTKAVAKAK